MRSGCGRFRMASCARAPDATSHVPGDVRSPVVSTTSARSPAESGDQFPPRSPEVSDPVRLLPDGLVRPPYPRMSGAIRPETRLGKRGKLVCQTQVEMAGLQQSRNVRLAGGPLGPILSQRLARRAVRSLCAFFRAFLLRNRIARGNEATSLSFRGRVAPGCRVPAVMRAASMRSFSRR